MPYRNDTSKIIDALLRIAVTGGVLSVALVAPNSLKILDKPLQTYFRKLDKKQREREMQKTLRYMRSRDLIKDDYRHGIAITKKGRQRIERINLDELSISKPRRWDKKWRIVLFDIPEDHKVSRDALTSKLRSLGFYQLQKSVWIFPHECRQEIEAVTSYYNIAKFVTYIESSHIDKQEILEKKFNI